MGLDACVYCDCFERGRLRVAPRGEWGVRVAEEGYRRPGTRDLDEQMAFDVWNHWEACEHRDGMLVHHYLGNIALVAVLREVLGGYVDRLPVIVTKVIYNGIHGGDWLSMEDVGQLAGELDVLGQIHVEDKKKERFIRDFERQLRELVGCSLRVRKPIVF